MLGLIQSPLDSRLIKRFQKVSIGKSDSHSQSEPWTIVTKLFQMWFTIVNNFRGDVSEMILSLLVAVVALQTSKVIGIINFTITLMIIIMNIMIIIIFYQAVVVDLLALPRPDNCSLLLDQLEVNHPHHRHHQCIIIMWASSNHYHHVIIIIIFMSSFQGYCLMQFSP